MALLSPKLRNSARGEQCTFQIPSVCRHDPERTVLAHIRDETKGMGNKARDWSAAFACDLCHDAIDQHRLSRADEFFYCLRALQRTWQRWIDRGLIVLPVDPETAKKRPKKKHQWPTRKLESRNTFARRGHLMQPLHGEIDAD